MTELFDKPRRLIVTVPGWVGFMIDVLVWQVRKKKMEQRKKPPTADTVLEGILINYFTSQKHAILELLSDEAEQELLTNPLHAGLAPSGLLRFAHRLRSRLARASADSPGARGTPVRPKRASNAHHRPAERADGSGIPSPGAPRWEH